MKLKTEKGEWVIQDGVRTIRVSEGEVAFGYIMTMAKLRAHKCITPALAPVRSLVPHPKKRGLTKKQREFVRAYKAKHKF